MNFNKMLHTKFKTGWRINILVSMALIFMYSLILVFGLRQLLAEMKYGLILLILCFAVTILLLVSGLSAEHTQLLDVKKRKKTASRRFLLNASTIIRALCALALCAVSVFGIYIIGFIPCTAIYMMLTSAYAFRGKAWWRILIYALVAATALILASETLMSIAYPAPILLN